MYEGELRAGIRYHCSSGRSCRILMRFPVKTKLALGDAVVMDFGARYCGILLRYDPYGVRWRAGSEVRRAYGAIRRANENAKLCVPVFLVPTFISMLKRFLPRRKRALAAPWVILLVTVWGSVSTKRPSFSSGTSALCGQCRYGGPGVYLTGDSVCLEDFGVVREASYEGVCTKVPIG